MITERGDAAAYRCVLLGTRARRHGGLSSHDLQQLARALRRAHESRERHDLASSVDGQPRWTGQDPRDWCSTGEAAALLQLSRRSVQRMARDPGGFDSIRVGRAYLLRLAPILALAEERNDRPDGLPQSLATARRAGVVTR